MLFCEIKDKHKYMLLFIFENKIDQKQGVGEYLDGEDRAISDASLSIFLI